MVKVGEAGMRTERKGVWRIFLLYVFFVSVLPDPEVKIISCNIIIIKIYIAFKQ